MSEILVLYLDEASQMLLRTVRLDLDTPVPPTPRTLLADDPGIVVIAHEHTDAFVDTSQT